MKLWPRSLQAQFALRLAAVFLLATAAGIGALFYESGQTADALRREELLQRAGELAGLIEPQADGAVQIALPPGLEQTYRVPGTTNLFVVRSEAGQILAASKPEAAASIHDWPLGSAAPRYVRSRRIEQTGQEYCALTLRADSKAGPVSITVARALDGDALAHTVLKDFVFDIAWAIP